MTNQAIDIQHIFASNSKLLVEAKLIKELGSFIEHQRSVLEVEKNQMIYWVLRFMKFHNHQHPTDLVQSDIESFLSSLATENHYNQKLQQSAEKSIQYLYTTFLKLPINPLRYISVQQRKSYLEYFGENQCKRIAKHLSGKSLLILELMLLGKLRFSEVIKLKDADVDIKNNRINIFDDKSASSERKLLFTISIPLKLILDLRIQKMRIKQLFGHHTSQMNRNKHSKTSMMKINLLFHSAESLFGSEEKIANIKQCFKQDLRRAISKLNGKIVKLAESKNKRRFKQLRIDLDEIVINRMDGNKIPKRIKSEQSPVNLDRKQRQNRDYQYELEVA